MYKIIMHLATINSIATSQTLRNNLQLLGVYTATVSNDNTSNYYSISDTDLCMSENSHTSQRMQASRTNGGAAPIEPTVTAGTSQCGRVPTMSRKMAESVSHQNFYGDQGMNYMASQATTNEKDEDIFHDSHLQLQERMRNPIAFHAEMMGNIMYLQQALRQPDAKVFIQAVIKEVNGHVSCSNRTLQKQSEVPKDIQIVPSV